MTENAMPAVEPGGDSKRLLGDDPSCELAGIALLDMLEAIAAGEFSTPGSEAA